MCQSDLEIAQHSQPPNRRIAEHRLHPPCENVLFNPVLQTFPRSGVKKSFYRVERLDHPLHIAAPISHFWVVAFNSMHIRLLSAKRLTNASTAAPFPPS